jgi:hypothetical protein
MSRPNISMIGSVILVLGTGIQPAARANPHGQWIPDTRPGIHPAASVPRSDHFGRSRSDMREPRDRGIAPARPVLRLLHQTRVVRHHALSTPVCLATCVAIASISGGDRQS